MPYTGKVSNAGISVDTNNDGIPDGRAISIKNGGNFNTFSLANGVLTVQGPTGGAAVGGSNTHVQFNDGGALAGESTFTYNKTSNTLSIANVVISGDLTVSGTTTTINTATLDVADNIITLNSDLGGAVAPSQNAGILINRGSSDDAQFIWDEGNDQWNFSDVGGTEHDLAGVAKVFAKGAGAVYTFTSDTDTGIEHTGTDQLGLLVGSNRRLMANADGVHIVGGTGNNASGAGANQALLVDNISIDTNTIASVNTNGNIVLAPNGAGDVQLDADTVRVGDSGANATITTNGAGDLVLNTNAGTNSGAITIEDGANNDILIMPNGSGKVGVNQATPTHRLHVDGDALITGGLTVQGTTTTASTTNTLIADSLITLNEGESGTGVTGNIAGFEIDRGANTEIARFVWDDNDDYFKPQIETGGNAGTYNSANLKVNIFDAAGAVTIAGNLNVDTNVLFVDAANNRVGINKTPTVALDVSGSAAISGDLTAANVNFTKSNSTATVVTVRNDTGSTIVKGAPLTIANQAHASGVPSVTPQRPQQQSPPNGRQGVGIAFADIANGAEGEMIVSGLLTQVPFTAFENSGTSVPVGSMLYASHVNLGELTTGRPTANSKFSQAHGMVIRSDIVLPHVSQGQPVAGSGTCDILVNLQSDYNYLNFDQDNMCNGRLEVSFGGTGQNTAQGAIDVLTGVTTATTGHVLTKDGSGNATFQAAPGGDTYDLNAGTKSGTSVPIQLTSGSGNDDSVVNLTEGTNITLTRNSATQVTIAAAGGGATAGYLTKLSGTNVDVTGYTSQTTALVFQGAGPTLVPFVPVSNQQIPAVPAGSVVSGSVVLLSSVPAGSGGNVLLDATGSWTTQSFNSTGFQEVFHLVFINTDGGNYDITSTNAATLNINGAAAYQSTTQYAATSMVFQPPALGSTTVYAWG